MSISQKPNLTYTRMRLPPPRVHPPHLVPQKRKLKMYRFHTQEKAAPKIESVRC
jgi:hypothetical protein